MTKFNDPATDFNVLDGQINKYRPNYEVAVGVKETSLMRGKWLKLNDDRKLEEVSGSTGDMNCVVILEPGYQSDVRGLQYNLDGTEFGGIMPVVHDDYTAEVGEIGWDSTLAISAYASGVQLKVINDVANDNGCILVPASVGDIVSAVSLGINERNMLVFTTRGGNVKKES